jgi:hypothetical protein
MPKPTFAPQYVPPGFTVQIVDNSQPSLPPNVRVGAFIGQGSKTMNRVDELIKGVLNGQDGPLESNIVIDIASIVDVNNVSYLKGVDFKISRVGDTAFVDWSPVASLTGTANLAALTPDATVLNGTYLNLVVNNGDPIAQSVQLTGFTNATTPAQIAAFINSWHPTLVGVATINASNQLVLSQNSVVINQGSANTILGFITGQYAQVQEPATGVQYQVYYSSDKLAAEYLPQLFASIAQGVPVLGPVTPPTILISGAPTGIDSRLLTDTTQAMTPDSHVGHYLKITGGPGKGQVRVIYSNTATQFSLSQDWTPGNLPDVTSTYMITDVNFNSIILGAQTYANLNGTLFISSQTPDDVFDVNNEKGAINNLEKDIQGIWPNIEVFMRGLGSTDMASVSSFLSAHVTKMSDVLHNKFRGATIGLAQNTNDFSVYTQLAQGILNRRMILMAPSQVPIDFGNGVEFYDGSFAAAGLAGIYCDYTVDAGAPIFGKPLSAAIDVGSFSDPFLDVEKNAMATAGVCIIERQGVDLVVRDDLTTDQSTDFSSGIKFMRMSDGIAIQVSTQMSQTLKGKRFSSDIVALAQSQFTVILNSYQVPQVPADLAQIDHVENLSVSQNQTQKQQLDLAANIFLIGDVKWEYALLGFGL